MKYTTSPCSTKLLQNVSVPYWSVITLSALYPIFITPNEASMNFALIRWDLVPPT